MSFSVSVRVTGRGLPGTWYGYREAPERALADLRADVGRYKAKEHGKPRITLWVAPAATAGGGHAKAQ